MINIYKITNNISNKIYVGQTIKSIEDRFKGHYYSREEGKGEHRYNLPIRRAMRKYPKDSFKIELIATCETREDANNKETEMILKHNSTDRRVGYNIAKGALGGDTLTHHPKIKEIGEAISKKLTGKGNHLSKPTELTSIETGDRMVFESASLCGNWIRDNVGNIADSSLKRKCSGVIKNNIVLNKYKVMWYSECND